MYCADNLIQRVARGAQFLLHIIQIQERTTALTSYERDGPLGLTSKPKTSLPAHRVTFRDAVMMPYPRIVPY